MTGNLRVLIVEDEALIAMDLAAIIEDCGHSVIAEAPSLKAVRDLPSAEQPDLAFVDMQLADNSNGLQVCELIQEQWRDTLIVFVTANPARIPADMAGGHGIMAKPFSRTGVGLALEYLSYWVFDPPPKCPVPANVEIGPALRKRQA